jgi:hypothetical protein
VEGEEPEVDWREWLVEERNADEGVGFAEDDTDREVGFVEDDIDGGVGSVEEEVGHDDDNGPDDDDSDGGVGSVDTGVGPADTRGGVSLEVPADRDADEGVWLSVDDDTGEGVWSSKEEGWTNKCDGLLLPLRLSSIGEEGGVLGCRGKNVDVARSRPPTHSPEVLCVLGSRDH